MRQVCLLFYQYPCSSVNITIKIKAPSVRKNFKTLAYRGILIAMSKTCGKELPEQVSERRCIRQGKRQRQNKHNRERLRRSRKYSELASSSQMFQAAVGVTFSGDNGDISNRKRDNMGQRRVIPLVEKIYVYPDKLAVACFFSDNRRELPFKETRRIVMPEKNEVRGARVHNLKKLHLSTAATNGKKMSEHVLDMETSGIRQVKLIDAIPLGINVRSTVATYANAHDELRKTFARTPGEIAENPNSITRQYVKSPAEGV